MPRQNRRDPPQQIAKRAADRYFGALATRIPYDTAPGDVDLIKAVCDIEDAITKRRQGSEKPHGQDRDDAMQAGYLLGVEIGRRLGGAR